MLEWRLTRRPRPEPAIGAATHPRLEEALDATPPRLSVTVVDDVAALAEHRAAWENLAVHALEANVFYEPWLLLPALASFAVGAAMQFVLVYVRTPGTAPLLCGFFPLERVSHYRGLPLPHLRLWQNRFCVLGTPLLRKGYEDRTLRAFHEWLRAEPGGAQAMQWARVSGDGPFHAALGRAIAGARLPRFLVERHLRGLLCRRESAEAFLAEALPKKSRREFRRQERRLAEHGPLEYAECTDAADAGRWIASFVALESAGWKGRVGTALASSPARLAFFMRAAHEAARRRQLQMLGLFVAGRPVALKCNFLARGGGFTWKIAYDEAFQRYSPGALLELENIRRFHARAEPPWMDSCAIPGHFMINRLWLDRRVIQTLIVSSGRLRGSFAVQALPAARWLYRLVRSAAPAPRGA